ncbi:TonB-dependent siderophore receptor [Flavobacterium sp. K5-23]|uniref:TonB-dependent receptor plug domain-containing protein n=1 Tax=Flavobacterium sp. K5-23 TaxID=2746225 RepID=UPI00200C5BEA|nr:TonB-dependent receptor [Flavobacterium sp. K5-23]UQD56845.1 TonB-dependent receptor [Flavobacterium sp. K5-23]
MKKTFLILVLLITMTGHSQKVLDTIKPIQLKEIKLPLQRYTKSSKKTTQKIETISQKEIEQQNFQNTADLLSNSGTLTVQKSQQGGGSPVIRGFEANRILLLVDGIRMNNLIFRSGHLQNVITVDENMLEQVDVLFGPSSTIFGSDAMGGAINLKTKDAKLLSEINTTFSGNASTRYSSSNEEKSGYLDLNFAGKKWGSLSAFSYNDFGDLRMGSKKNGKNDFFGERPFYVETINGNDQLVPNSDKLVQKFSGYTQYNAMQKVVFQQNETAQHSLNLQLSTTSDVPRYDRLTDQNGTKLKNVRWDYGPQKRFLAAYKLTKENVFLNSDMSLGFNYQNVEESRITRKFNNDNTKTQLEKINVYSINADFETKIGKGDFLYGAEMFYDDLNSSATNSNRKTGAVTVTDSRYPNGINHTLRTDVFATYSSNINDKTAYNFGARAGYVTLKSTIADNSIFSFPFDEINQSNFTYSGAAGIVNNNSTTRIAFNLATGFRVPNIDDLGKLFDSASGILIVPNQNIKPEKSVSAELSITLFKGKTIEFENTLFYTRLFDAIITDKFLFNGQSVVNYAGQPSTVFANQNMGTANVTGVTSTLKITITKPLQFYGSFNFTNGRIVNNNSDRPLDHIPPFYGKTGLKYENKNFNLDFYMLYNGKKDISDYFLNGEDNEQYAPVEGMPAWQTFNLKGATTVVKNLTLYSGIENILDTQYRTFASGINASGRNIYIGAKIHF